MHSQGLYFYLNTFLKYIGFLFCWEHCSMDRVTHFTLRTNCRVQPSIISRTRACAAEREMERESEKAGAER